MAFLTIDGKQFEAKANFKFERTADKKYKDEKDQLSGLEKVYQDLMSYKIGALLVFWDCATAHYHKNQPSLEKIEDALTELIEEDPDSVDNLFKDAFQTVDNSGFFKLQLREFWKNLDLVDKMAKDEKEKEEAQLAKQMYLDKRKELNPSITMKSSPTAEDTSEYSTQN